MTDHTELRVNVDVAREFGPSSFDDSSMMSCPSFASSASSGSRRDSITSIPYDQTYAHQSHGLRFAPTSSFLDMEQVSSMHLEDMDLPFLEVSGDKPEQSWSLDYSPAYPQTPIRQIGPDGNLSRTTLENFHIDTNLHDCHVPEYGQSGTIAPSVAFGSSHYGHTFSSPLTPNSDSPQACIADQCQQQSIDGRSWSHAPFFCDQQPSPKPSLDSMSSPPRPLSNHHAVTRSYRIQKPQKVTKMSKLGLVEASARIDCTFKDETGCTARFQRPEHLTRHLKTVHSEQCPYVCELDFCKDRKTGLRTAFNRKDNKHAHIVNCHLMDSDKPRRDRIKDMEQIEKLGWAPLLAVKTREEEKRKAKFEGSTTRPKSNARAKRSGASVR